MMSKRRQLQPSAGTRTGWDAAKAFFRTPSDTTAEADQEAFRQGKGRAVSCFLRGSVDPYPRHTRQGVLELTQAGIVWRPTWGLHRRVIPITEQIHSVDIRQAGRSEWNVKKGGKAFGVLPVPEYQVVVCKTDRGELELSIPSADIGLVKAALSRLKEE